MKGDSRVAFDVRSPDPGPGKDPAHQLPLSYWQRPGETRRGGVLPCGTGNLLARNLGLPLSLDEALTVALTESDRRLDVGTANGRPFVVMAGIGFDAEMPAGAGEDLKKRMGWAAYVLSALRHLRDRPIRVVLRADSSAPQRRWASGVIVGNIGCRVTFGCCRTRCRMTVFLTWRS
jgi:diacylglycerol kinase family enzyme